MSGMNSRSWRMITRRNLLTLFVLTVLFIEQSMSCRSGRLLKSGGLTCSEKQVIVETHNQLRQRVATGRVEGQPSAINMLEMSWDDELARQAQSWADQCTFRHDSGRRVARFAVGQNLATSWSSPSPSALGSSPDFATQIRNWFNEVYTVGYHGSFSHGSGHYSQVVWGDTYLVGCGYSYYLESDKYSKIYVCNYGPAGNIRGAAAYRYGSPACTLQGTSPSKKYQGLCEVQGYSSSNTCYSG